MNSAQQPEEQPASTDHIPDAGKMVQDEPVGRVKRMLGMTVGYLTREVPLGTDLYAKPQPSQHPTKQQIDMALKAACMHSTPESRKDMRRALEAANGIKDKT